MIAYRTNPTRSERIAYEQRRIGACAVPTGIVKPVGESRVLIADVLDLVAFEMGIALADLVGPCRDARLVRGRAAVAWIARVGLGRQLNLIGRALGGRDHSTVAVGLRRAEALRAQDPAFRAVTAKILRQLEGMAA